MRGRAIRDDHSHRPPTRRRCSAYADQSMAPLWPRPLCHSHWMSRNRSRETHDWRTLQKPVLFNENQLQLVSVNKGHNLHQRCKYHPSVTDFAQRDAKQVESTTSCLFKQRSQPTSKIQLSTTQHWRDFLKGTHQFVSPTVRCGRLGNHLTHVQCCILWVRGVPKSTRRFGSFHWATCTFGKTPHWLGCSIFSSASKESYCGDGICERENLALHSYCKESLLKKSIPRA